MLDDKHVFYDKCSLPPSFGFNSLVVFFIINLCFFIVRML
jgi:hypothetical protein